MGTGDVAKAQGKAATRLQDRMANDLSPYNIFIAIKGQPYSLAPTIHGRTKYSLSRVVARQGTFSEQWSFPITVESPGFGS